MSGALIQAASIMQASDHDCKKVVFLSHALSVLQAYQNHKLPNLAKALQQVAATRRAVLQWIPAHCGIFFFFGGGGGYFSSSGDRVLVGSGAGEKRTGGGGGGGVGGR